MRSARSGPPAQKERIYLEDAETRRTLSFVVGPAYHYSNGAARWESDLISRRMPVRNLRVLCVSAPHALKYLLASPRPRRDALVHGILPTGNVQHGSETTHFVFKRMLSHKHSGHHRNLSVIPGLDRHRPQRSRRSEQTMTGSDRDRSNLPRPPLAATRQDQRDTPAHANPASRTRPSPRLL